MCCLSAQFPALSLFGSHAMLMRVDKGRCTGHALCALAAPNLIDLNDDGYNETAPRSLAPADVDEARRAWSVCPERAVVLDEVDA